MRKEQEIINVVSSRYPLIYLFRKVKLYVKCDLLNCIVLYNYCTYIELDNRNEEIFINLSNVYAERIYYEDKTEFFFLTNDPLSLSLFISKDNDNWIFNLFYFIYFNYHPYKRRLKPSQLTTRYVTGERIPCRLVIANNIVITI